MTKAKAIKLKKGDVVYICPPRVTRSHWDMPVCVVERVTPNGGVLARCGRYKEDYEFPSKEDIQAHLYDAPAQWSPYHHVWKFA
jgi:hypothetical protein